ncbi:HlyD family efflux transporter periplasmic adaptor subunit [Blastopirellula sp. JC732]|uniref:HlyD family efflux transporter periplasmic adaptor subunit n=1 Tax=Blastopirellula sediminis TaxID=2894196 RepID=A0A9X1SMV6_9BACT|nr:HlyD family efflux transporter periplasmic adaptor subunit [Blastopirellula sediminis]MCC9604617.1 HlyD family efflux transporter periplasmic adaptor subunit [Blastopirellula sediminis]MCC9632084.1 HlyD family efflux transporter periplasmic adaptor subunit [Blastopirellula sediminis]
MATLTDSLIASSSRPLGLRIRPDLTARRHYYQGRAYWVVKEPLGLNYFRFQEEEYAILQMLDGHTSLETIKEKFEREFAPQKIGFRELQQFIGTLHRSGLIIAESRDQGRQLRKRRDSRKWNERLQTASNILSIRFKGIDPEWLLNAMLPYTRWLFTMPALIFFSLYALTALLLVLVQYDTFRSRLPEFQEFFGPEWSNWMLLGCVLAATKVCHEFGHGLSCKRFGGECHEMGVMFLVLTPCLYCNVSDSWMLPNKWHRAAIGAAGMYIEIILASTATFLWWFSEPGLLNHLCLQVMFVSSISTIVFNGNPLLRYDGYYILSDVMEVPNMRQKASTILQRYLSEWCLGLEQPEDPFLPQRNRLGFGLYTIASNIYRWVVMFSILYFLNQVFEPMGLKVIGQTIALMGLWGLVVMPLWKFGKFMYVPGRMSQVKRKNVLATVAVAVGVVAGIALIPLPQWVNCPVEVRPENAEVAYVVVPGVLEEMLVQPGQKVEKGSQLARVINYDLLTQIAELEEEEKRLTRLRDSLHHLRLGDNAGGSFEQRYMEVRKQLESASEQLRKKRIEQQLINVPAPVSGFIFPSADRRDPQSGSGQLPTWTGSPFEKRNQGAYVTTSDALCQIGESDQMEAVIYVDQDYVELVRMGQEVYIKLDAFPGKTFETKLAEIGDKQVEFVPNSLTVQQGGELAAETDPLSGRARPQNATFPAQAPLTDVEAMTAVGLRGRAKIFVDWQPLGLRLWRYVNRTFHFKL